MHPSLARWPTSGEAGRAGDVVDARSDVNHSARRRPPPSTSGGRAQTRLDEKRSRLGQDREQIVTELTMFDDTYARDMRALGAGGRPRARHAVCQRTRRTVSAVSRRLHIGRGSIQSADHQPADAGDGRDARVVGRGSGIAGGTTRGATDDGPAVDSSGGSASAPQSASAKAASVRSPAGAGRGEMRTPAGVR